MYTCKRAYRKLGNQGLFDSGDRSSKLTSLGNPLGRLTGTVDFEMFRETLEAGLHRERLTKAGAKPYDYVLMFKILVLQRMYNLSDEQAEYQIVDRTSFRDFLGLASGDKVPDARTIWAFREQLIKKAVTTSADQHDSVPAKLLIDNDDRGQELHADSAYIGKSVKSVMRKYQMKDRVIKRGVRGKSSTRSRKRSTGRIPRRECVWSMVYNVCRYEQIVRIGMN